MSVPLLSVVMPVRNALPFLDASIESILGQSFGDFEFVILDDASSDGSTDRLNDWATRDSRIRLVRSPEPLGPVGSSQRAVEHSQGKLVARMDADDISHADRLKRQVELLAMQPDAGMVAALNHTIDSEGRLLRPPDASRLLRASVFAPFVHGSIMYRREIFDAAGGYRDGTSYWEDIDLFLRMAAKARILVIPDALYRHRISPASTRRASNWEAVSRAYAGLYRSLASRRSSEDGVMEPVGKIPPQVFVLIGSPIIWVGERPRLLRWMLSEAALGATSATFASLAWAVWAEAHPRSLRHALRTRLRIRNRQASKRLAGRSWVEWAPPPAS